MKDSIINSIKVLPPFSESIKDILRVCNDEDSSLIDVVNVVKKDPNASATLLKIANSSLYGSRKVKIVDRAIGMFGKAVTKSFLVSKSVLDSFEIDLSPYGISEEEFLHISLARLILMSEWYEGIDPQKVEVLATCAQLANIGQVVLAKEIINAGHAKEFSEALASGEEEVDELEIEFTGITSLEVTIHILRHWKLDESIVHALENSTSVEYINHASEDIRDYALACYCVLNAIDGVGKENATHMEDVYDMLDQNDLDETKFVTLLEQVKHGIHEDE
jgi:HD-like signal output (HDOD) protein